MTIDNRNRNVFSSSYRMFSDYRYNTSRWFYPYLRKFQYSYVWALPPPVIIWYYACIFFSRLPRITMPFAKVSFPPLNNRPVQSILSTKHFSRNEKWIYLCKRAPHKVGAHVSFLRNRIDPDVYALSPYFVTHVTGVTHYRSMNMANWWSNTCTQRVNFGWRNLEHWRQKSWS